MASARRGGNHQALLPLGGGGQAGWNIPMAELGKIHQQLSGSRASCPLAQDIADREPRPPHPWFPNPYGWVDRAGLKQAYAPKQAPTMEIDNQRIETRRRALCWRPPPKNPPNYHLSAMRPRFSAPNYDVSTFQAAYTSNTAKFVTPTNKGFMPWGGI